MAARQDKQTATHTVRVSEAITVSRDDNRSIADVLFACDKTPTTLTKKKKKTKHVCWLFVDILWKLVKL